MGTTTSQSHLDSDELLHLAITASRQDQHEKAIGYLKQALEISPDSARTHYMLGAEHAQIGLYERAMEEMSTAIRIDPSLHTARFQLGLLFLSSARVDEAVAAWRELDELGPEHPLHLFKTGLQALARDDFESCRTHLEKGIERNGFSAALNNDMRRVLDGIGKAKHGDAAGGDAGSNGKAGEHHVFLSAYTDSDKTN